MRQENKVQLTGFLILYELEFVSVFNITFLHKCTCSISYKNIKEKQLWLKIEFTDCVLAYEDTDGRQVLVVPLSWWERCIHLHSSKTYFYIRLLNS